MRTRFEFGILGSTIVHPHGNPLVQADVPRKFRQVLAALLAQPNRRLSFAQLVEWVWTEDEQPPADRKTTGHTYRHRISRLLADAGAVGRLSTVNGGLRVDTDESQIDYYVFRNLLSQARNCRDEKDHECAVDLAEEALGLWRDQPLLDLDTSPARNWRQAVLAEEWLPANLFLLDEQIALGRFDAALARHGEISRRHGFDPRLIRRQLRILHSLSRHSEATDTYLASYRKLRGDGQDAEAQELRHFHDELQRRFESGHPAEPVRIVAGPRLLPPDVAGFIGRADLLRMLDEHTGVAAGRLRASVVVLAGIGGIGKTTLAVRWARRASNRLSAGVLFADLHGFSQLRRLEPGDVVDDFLAQLGYPVEHIVGPAGRAEKLRALLEAGPKLIVLDNVQNSAHVRALLPLFGDCAVVITSRHRLTELAVRHGIPSWTVGPLGAAHGIELLSDRIGARASEVPETLRVLVELCHGLPLALTLVAERIASRPAVPVPALVTQLRDSELLLAIGQDGDSPDGSLNAVFSLSYQALSVEAGRLFRLLGLHPGAEFGVGVAAALAGEGLPATRQHLDELVGAQLMEQAGDVDRFRVHDLVLAFAAGLADGDPEADQAVSRMLDFYLGTALDAHRVAFPHIGLPPVPAEIRGMTIAGNEEADAWYLRERSNLGAIIHSAWIGRTRYGWALPHVAARFMDRFGFYADLVSALTVTAEMLAAQRNPEAVASTLNDLGFFQLTLGDTEPAARNFERALKILAEVDAPTGILTVRINLAATERKRGDRAAATAIYRECLTMARAQGDVVREAKVEHYLGETAAEERRYDVAVGHFERALELREALADTAGQVSTLAERCQIAGARGQYRVADEFAARASVLLATVQDVSAAIRLHTVVAELNLSRRRYADAVESAGLALQLTKQTGLSAAEASALDLLGRAYAAAGEPEQARAVWLLAADIFRRRGRQWQADRLTRRVESLPAAPPIPGARPADITQPGVSLDETPDLL
ncbi:tetratricopeptide repeat protein [Amycolatopsis pithecellobii]|uniref:tetratricopeptide repeat protein n=1 Tax=Amycolatopsis pithecellobii TaxID=664692 RepID=UPI00140B443C|nr:tetratricopeptide repeat protein [Amycolatopsis pithecellobii]